jgi:monoamine oxidase
MAEKLGARLALVAKVKRIERLEQGMRVVFERNGKTESVEAARVVCALPSTVLRSIQFEPALSADKQRAIADLTMVSVTRVYLGCERKIWSEQSHAAAAETDDWLKKLTDETDAAEGATGLLGVYAVGDASRRLAHMSEAERLAAVKALAERVHPGVEPLIYGGTSKCWDDDPLLRGAYANFRPKELTTLAVSLARAEGRIHFAGDQTSYRPGFMHGALGSAKRVVNEIAG